MATNATKVAIVTGAGSGIGQETAIALAQADYVPLLVGRTRATLDETADRIEQAAPPTGDARANPTRGVIVDDVADPQAPARIVDETLHRFGRIDALVNVAGSAPLQPIQDITPRLWRQTVDVNLSAAVLLTAAAWPTFQRQRSGVIVNISSMSSIDPFRGFSIYAAAKIGLNMFTRCTADEGEAIGVRAVAIAPGAVETAMLRRNFDESVMPRDQTMHPRQVARVIVDCITGARLFEPGETIILT